MEPVLTSTKYCNRSSLRAVVCGLSVAALYACSLMAPPDSEFLQGDVGLGGSTSRGGALAAGGSGGRVPGDSGGAGTAALGGSGGEGEPGGSTSSGGEAAGGSGGLGGTSGLGGAQQPTGGAQQAAGGAQQATGGEGPGPLFPEPILSALSVWLRADRDLDVSSNRITAWRSGGLPDGYVLSQSESGKRPSQGPRQLSNTWLPTFDGQDDLLVGYDAHAFTSQQGFSFFLVLIPDSLAGHGDILSVIGEGEDRLVIARRGASLSFGRDSSIGGAPLTVTNVFRVGEPVMVALISTLDPRGVSIFVNGQPVASSAIPFWDPDLEQGLALGRLGEEEGFSGSVAEVLIYSDSLGTAARAATEVYLQGRWKCCR